MVSPESRSLADDIDRLSEVSQQDQAMLVAVANRLFAARASVEQIVDDQQVATDLKFETSTWYLEQPALSRAVPVIDTYDPYVWLSFARPVADLAQSSIWQLIVRYANTDTPRQPICQVLFGKSADQAVIDQSSAWLPLNQQQTYCDRPPTAKTLTSDACWLVWADSDYIKDQIIKRPNSPAESAGESAINRYP